MTTIREYAAEKGVSYEAVRRQVARYSAELEGHIEKRGKMQLLDDFAVAFLDEHRAGNAVAIYKADAASELKRLQRENKELSDELRAAYRDNSMLSQVAAENAQMLAEAKQTQLALTAAEQEKNELAAENQKIKAQNEALAAETAAANEKTRLANEAQERAATALTAAQQREKLMADYADALAKWAALPFWKRKKKDMPVKPEVSEVEE